MYPAEKDISGNMIDMGILLDGTPSVPNNPSPKIIILVPNS
jgi:hypothetical protein